MIAQIQINSFDDLLNFIKLDEVTTDQAQKVISTVLNVFTFEYDDKNNLIRDTETFINDFCRNGKKERPIFLCPLLDFDEMQKIPDVKKIVDKIEKEY